MADLIGSGPMASERMLHSGSGVVASGVRRTFGPVEAVRGIDLNASPGEVTALVGPNGAGKTTLLRGLSRLNDAEFEEATLLGAPLPSSPYDVVMAGLVHVPERRRLFPGLTVQDNLELGARRLGKGAKKTKEEDLERVFTLFPKLKERAGQAAGTLSGGEQQQCAIGRGLMARPKVLLLDEPTLGLSVGVKEAIVGSIQVIKDAGTTMLLVEQDVSFAFRCADRVIVLEHGQVAREGPTAQIANDPYVKQAYLGVA